MAVNGNFFGLTLQVFREKQGISQREMARRLKYSSCVQSQLENGVRGPSPKYIKRLAKAFDMDDRNKLSWNELGAKAAGWEIE